MATYAQELREGSKNKLIRAALLLCLIELASVLIAATGNVIAGHPIQILMQIAAISWLGCGLGSMILASVGAAKSAKATAVRTAALSILLLSLLSLVFSAFGFLIV